MSQFVFVNDDDVPAGESFTLEINEAAKPQIESSSLQHICKRLIDLCCATIGLMVFGPAMLFTALAIWRGGGPVLFRQQRIGRGGAIFNCLKFRTMCVDAEQRLMEHLAQNPEAAREWHQRKKLSHDPRVTGLGRFLRKSSLDELPQLLNVLRGDMSIVGPRPIVHDEIEKYGQHFQTYCSVLPGITGLWQISGRSNVSYDERVRLDVEYVQTWSVATDIKIIAKTVPAVLWGHGAV